MLSHVESGGHSYLQSPGGLFQAVGCGVKREPWIMVACIFQDNLLFKLVTLWRARKFSSSDIIINKVKTVCDITKGLISREDVEGMLLV